MTQPNIFTHKPLNSLTFGSHNKGGRNNQGNITVRHRGGGHKPLLRILNLHPRWSFALILRLEYDPQRSAPIILVLKDKKHLDYIIASIYAKPGYIIYKKSQPLPGAYLPLSLLPQGTLFHNLLLKYIKAAGTSGILLSTYKKTSTIKIPSQRLLRIQSSAIAAVGKTAFKVHSRSPIKKAGQLRKLGIRPTVKGEAINAVDHPHGGSTKGGKPTQSRWGKVLHSPQPKSHHLRIAQQ